MADREKFEVLLRLKSIELIAYWEGRLVTSQLIKQFGISRQQASKDIKRYTTNHNPDSLDYSVDIKGYKPSSKFKPVLTNGHINEYMDMMSGLVSQAVPVTIVCDPHIAAVHLPDRAVKPEIVRGLIQSCRTERPLKIEYVSMNNPIPHTRIFSPHTLIYTGFRWHVRGYCHERNDFRDFLISRISSVSEVDDVAFIGDKDDRNWHEEIEISIIPNKQLTEAQQNLIADDFTMENQILNLKLRKSLVHYTLQRYQVALSENEMKNPFQYPLQMKPDSDINQWLFGREA